MPPKKSKSAKDAVTYTDGTFFADMRAAERRILEELGATEALKDMDKEEAEAQAEYEREEKASKSEAKK